MEPTREALEEFSAHAAAEAEERGIALTLNDLRDLYTTAIATGQFNPQGTRDLLDNMAEQQQPEPEWEPDEEPEPTGLDRLQQDFNHDAERLQHQLGRALTVRELETLSGSALEQAARHNAIDLSDAAREHGIGSWDQMSPGDQARVMADRVRDLGGEDDLEITVAEDGRPASDPDWNAYPAAGRQGVEFEDEPDEAA